MTGLSEVTARVMKTELHESPQGMMVRLGGLGVHGVFARTLETVASLNPFKDPTVPPGVRARKVEEHLRELEVRMSETTVGSTKTTDGSPEVQIKLAEVRKFLKDSVLLHEEQAVVLWKVEEYLTSRREALKELEGILVVEYRLSGPEVRRLLRVIGQMISGLKWAA